jgi:hypothetical protein
MRQDGRLAGRLLRVREPFKEQKDCFTFEFEFHGGGEALGGSRSGLYIPGRGACASSLPCHLCFPSSLVFAT